jgi:hypothetical protein
MHADHRLLLWRLVDARIPAEIAQLETHAGTTQPSITRLSDPAFVTSFPALRTAGERRPRVSPQPGDFPALRPSIW